MLGDLNDGRPVKKASFRQVVYIAVVLACGSAAAILAFLFRDIRFGTLPAGAAPVGVLGAVAAACLMLAIVSLLRSAGRRMDREFATEPAARAVAGSLTDLRLKQGLSKFTRSVIRYLPNRVSLVATDEGLELWGRPGISKYAKIVWADIESISPRRLPSGGWMSWGLRVDLAGSHVPLDIAIAGSAVSGFPSNDPVYVGKIVERLLQLKAISGH